MITLNVFKRSWFSYRLVCVAVFLNPEAARAAYNRSPFSHGGHEYKIYDMTGAAVGGGES